MHLLGDRGVDDGLHVDGFLVLCRFGGGNRDPKIQGKRCDTGGWRQHEHWADLGSDVNDDGDSRSDCTDSVVVYFNDEQRLLSSVTVRKCRGDHERERAVG